MTLKGAPRIDRLQYLVAMLGEAAAAKVHALLAKLLLPYPACDDNPSATRKAVVSVLRAINRKSIKLSLSCLQVAIFFRNRQEFLLKREDFLLERQRVLSQLNHIAARLEEIDESLSEIYRVAGTTFRHSRYSKRASSRRL